MEKRNFTRVVFQSEATVRARDKTLQGEMENLSLNGMFFKVPEALSMDEPVEVEILLSGTSSALSLRIEGHVSRISDDGVAIQFKGMSLDSFIHLKSIIAYNTGDEEEVMKEFYTYLRFHESQSGVDQGEVDL